jgi:glycosyltransferase involved in cell wall biosynthesis
MIVLYDHQMFSRRFYGGIARYCAELVNQSARQASVTCKQGFWFSRNPYLNPGIRKYDIISKAPYLPKKIERYIRKLNQKVSLSAIRENNYDVFHPTYYDAYFLEEITKPYVLTIHDMIDEIFNDDISKKDQQTVLNKKRLAKNAAHIIATSECTRKDILRYYGMGEEKISVVYHGDTFRDVKSLIPPCHIPQKYVLYVGRRSFYKNFRFFAKAMIPILQQDTELYVLCIGGGKFRPDEIAYLESLYMRDRFIQIGVKDSHLAWLYNHAQAFVFPSLYEGFGIPVLEAFSCSCPVIAGNRSSLPEVAGDAAVYFDPTDQDAMIQAVKSIIYDPQRKRDFVRRGKDRLAVFSWETTWNNTVDVYKKVIK